MLKDTDSTSLKFIFISDRNSETPENRFRDIIFEIIMSSEIYKRFDSSHEFWDICEARKEQKKENSSTLKLNIIDNPCILTLAVNPKECLELFEDKNLNKKHKDIKKGHLGLVSKTFHRELNH